MPLLNFLKEDAQKEMKIQFSVVISWHGSSTAHAGNDQTINELITLFSHEKQHFKDPIVGCENVFPCNIDSETRNGSNKISVTLVTGKEWHPVYFTPGSATLTTQESMSFSVRLIESNFEMKIPGGSAELLAELNRIYGRSIVLKLTFESGCAGKSCFVSPGICCRIIFPKISRTCFKPIITDLKNQAKIGTKNIHYS